MLSFQTKYDEKRRSSLMGWQKSGQIDYLNR